MQKNLVVFVCFFWFLSLYRLCHLIIFFLLLLLTFLFLLLHLWLQEGALYTRLCRCPGVNDLGPILPLLRLGRLDLPLSGIEAGSIGTSGTSAASSGSASSGFTALDFCCCCNNHICFFNSLHILIWLGLSLLQAVKGFCPWIGLLQAL